MSGDANLDYAGPRVVVRRKVSWRWLWILLVTMAGIIGLAWGWRATRPMVAARAIAAAKTPAEEEAAFNLMHETTRGYMVEFYDAAGVEVQAFQPGLVSVKVTWDNGTTVTAPIRDMNNVRILLRPD